MAQNTSVFSTLGNGQRLLLGVGLLAVFGVSLLLYMQLYKTEYRALYENLNAEDAAKVLAQLQEMKVQYRLADGGKKIMVDSGKLEETRVMMDGGELSIRGGEGFELFDNMDYGMTEFAQKINYQRALQGEISRTIIGLDEVRYARVHLVLPEQSLFKTGKTAPKASITIVEESGTTLSEDQILGIQELVASSVDGMEPSSVTLLNDSGVVLSRRRATSDDGMASRLGQKQEIERYLGAKTEKILNQMYGYGRTVVNIDVSLSFDQVQFTRETYTPSQKSSDTGVLSRSKTQRQYKRSGQDSSAATEKSPLYSETKELDYKIGKDTEQVVKGSGSVERMTVSVMVPDSASEQTIEALRQLVANAVGLRTDRGDSIEISALPLAQIEDMQAGVGEGEAVHPTTVVKTSPGQKPAPASRMLPALESFAPLFLLLVFAVVGLALLFLRRPREDSSLSDEQRQALLAEVKKWMDHEQEEQLGDGR